MQQLSGNSLGKYNKSCIVFHQESYKIGLAFFRFFTIFNVVYKNQQNTYTIEVPSLHQGPKKFWYPSKNTLGSRKRPREDSAPCNVAPGHGRRRRQPNSSGSGDGSAGQKWEGVRAHPRPICMLDWGGGATGGGGQRHQAVAATGATAPRVERRRLRGGTLRSSSVIAGKGRWARKIGEWLGAELGDDGQGTAVTRPR
jgi:hypothetical protein